MIRPLPCATFTSRVTFRRQRSKRCDMSATLPNTNATPPARGALPRGATLGEIEAAGIAVLPVHHDHHANAADCLSVGRALAYQMAADGRLPTIRLGARRLAVPVTRLRAMLDSPSTPVA
jgi:hypothetical protein